MGRPAHGAPPSLEIRDLRVGYRGTIVLDRIELNVEAGERLGIIGPNGAGKSTLLKTILGLVRASSGHVRVEGEPAARSGRRIAYLPQRQDIDWDHPVEVRDVVAMGRYPHRGPIGRLSAQDRRIVERSLDRVGLRDLAQRRISELSGGQQQRMALARVLAQQASVLLLDEPYTGLDAATVRIMDRELAAAATRGSAVIVVNHELAGLEHRYDRILVLSRRIISYGPPASALTREALDRAYGLGRVALAGPGEAAE